MSDISDFQNAVIIVFSSVGGTHGLTAYIV